MPVFWFGCGSRLLTDGYDLLFKPASGRISYVTSSHSGKPGTVFFDSDTKWLKATDDCIVFVNVEGETQVLAMSHQDHTREINIDSLYDVTLVENGKPVNSAGDSFLKFRGTRSLMFATPDGLYAKTKNGICTYRLA